jgi:hypothetical protein
MKLVCAALGDGIDVAAAGRPIFRPITERGNLDFGDRLGTDPRRGTVDARAHRRQTVHHVIVKPPPPIRDVGRVAPPAPVSSWLVNDAFIERYARHECTSNTPSRWA